MIDPEKFYTPRDVAKIYEVAVKTVHKWLKGYEGTKLEGYLDSQNRWHIKGSDIIEHANKLYGSTT